MRRRAPAKAGVEQPVARSGGTIPPAIILIGFMGAGKSSVGRCLAGHLGWDFEDLDERIERQEQRKVHEIFRESGETGFRMAEHAALQELLSEVHAGARKVVALGGGAFVQKENAKLIGEAGLSTIFLDANVKELWRRCREQADRECLERPLLSSLSSFRRLYKVRRPYYAQALLHQSTDGKTVDEIAVELVEMLGLSLLGPSKRDARKRSPRR